MATRRDEGAEVCLVRWRCAMHHASDETENIVHPITKKPAARQGFFFFFHNHLAGASSFGVEEKKIHPFMLIQNRFDDARLKIENEVYVGHGSW